MPAIGLCAVPFVPATQPYWCIVLMTVAFFCNGAKVQTTLANAHDLAPNGAASTMATINCLAASNGFISPLVVAYFTREQVREAYCNTGELFNSTIRPNTAQNTAAQWQYVFYIAGGVYVLAAAFFMCFGSATDQRWTEKRSARRLHRNGTA